MSSVAGVDGARGAWVVAIAPTDADAPIRLEQHSHFADVVSATDAADCAIVGVDMPIALAVDGPRTSDAMARAILGPRRSTLFPTPAEAVLDAETYADAQLRSREAIGRGLSKQAWNIVPMIRQVRSCVSVAMATRFIEVHPETTFATMAGEPLQSKKTVRGVGQRLLVLARHGVDPAPLLADAPMGCAIDDVLDALAIVWTARRHLEGRALVLGSGNDTAGYPQQIVA